MRDHDRPGPPQRPAKRAHERTRKVGVRLGDLHVKVTWTRARRRWLRRCLAPLAHTVLFLTEALLLLHRF